jgi:hypothetical protein
MTLWIAGALLVALAVYGFIHMQRTKSELHTMIGTETLSIPELGRLRDVSDELGAKGSFRKIAEVVATAHPRPQGLLTAELSKTECVWYRYTIDREYEDVEYRDGKRYESRRTENMVEHTSSAGYALIDQDRRTIGVNPNGANPDGVEQTVNRFEPHRGGGQTVEVFGFKLPDFVSSGGNSTLGYRYKEWVIRPGRRLYILGEVHDKIGPLVIGKPENGGHFVISTRTEQELRNARIKRHKFLSIGVIVCAIVGIALVVADFVV